MTISRLFIIVALILFAVIAGAFFWKRSYKKESINAPSQSIPTAVSQIVQIGQKEKQQVKSGEPIEIDISTFQPPKVPNKEAPSVVETSISSPAQKKIERIEEVVVETTPVRLGEVNRDQKIESVDRIDVLFKKNSPCPIVETIRYSSRTSWKRGKAAWLADYASHYKTPLDFIARSINKGPDYTIKTISDGIEFNVLKPNREFYFHLVVDLTRCMLWLYYIDPVEEESVLLKNYEVVVGRLDSSKASGCLTPLGLFKLGKRVAIFKPKMMGLHRGRRVELIGVFGTRWIPFEREIKGCSEPAKGFGLHGTSCQLGPDQKLIFSDSGGGKYDSDGCIRLSLQGIEEVFSVISTRDCFIEVVRDFHQVKLPYEEKKIYSW